MRRSTKPLSLGWKNETKKLVFFILLQLLSFNLLFSQTGILIEISGQVTDQEKNLPLADVSIQIKGTVAGTVTNSTGNFVLRTKTKLPFTLLFTSVGFKPQELEIKTLGSNLQVALSTQTVLGNEVVVTASRVAESILKSPVAIEKLDIRTIRETPAPSFYDALENVKGVQMTTSSLTFKIPNTRGFNIPNNFRFMQLVDGVDMQAATLGVPLGNAIGPTELDIQSVEITPGAASALYGMNAINGMANLITKDPFIHQGLSFYQKTGINHVDGVDALAGSNVVSVGGLTINGNTNQTLRVARTGYWETDLVSPKVDNLKFDAALHYKLSDKAELSYSYRIGKLDGVFQRGNKIRLDDVLVQNHHLELKGDNFVIRSYISIENTGNSYNVKPTADNLDLYSGGSNSVWGTKYKNALTAYAAANGPLTNANLAAATQYARTVADAGRAEPGTVRFDSLVNVITGINNWDIKSSTIPDAPETGGSALVQNSRLYHTEAQWDLTKYIKVFNLLIGGDYRLYQIIPDGNNFVDFSRSISERNKPLKDGSFGKNVHYNKVGFFAQVTKTFFDEKLKLFGSLRFDDNIEFKPAFTPRLAAVYTIKEKHNFRFTYQQGYRFPALFEALSYVNNGRVKRVGSLPYINEGLGYLENSYTQASVIAFNAAVSAKGNTDAAALTNKNLLVWANLPDARPEKINSLEVGYKSVLLDNKLVVDIDAYSNVYNGFLGQVQVFVPIGETVGSDAAVIAMLDRNRDATTASGGNAASKGQERYRVYTNAKNTYHNFGSALGITYNFYKKYTIAGNINYNKMKSNQSNDIFVTGFNTPQWSTNLSFGNREVVKNLGFNITWRWQDG